MARVAAVKVIAYKGVSKKSVAFGIAMYRKIAGAGKSIKRTYSYNSDLITVKYTNTKKEVRILYRASALYSGAGGAAPMIYALINEKIILLDGISEYQPEIEDVFDKVTLVNTDTYVAQGLQIATRSADSFYNNPVLGQARTPWSGWLYYDAGQKRNTLALISSTFQKIRNREHELQVFLDNFPTIRVRITSGNDLYTAGQRVVYLKRAFFGTDVDGNEAAVLQIINPFDQTDAADEIVVPDDALAKMNNNYQFVELENLVRSEYYGYYVAMPVDTFIEGAGKGLFSSGKVDEETGIPYDLDGFYDVHNVYPLLAEPQWFFNETYDYFALEEEYITENNASPGFFEQIRSYRDTFINWRQEWSANASSIAVCVAGRLASTYFSQTTNVDQITVSNQDDYYIPSRNVSYRVEFVAGALQATEIDVEPTVTLNTSGAYSDNDYRSYSSPGNYIDWRDQEFYGYALTTDNNLDTLTYGGGQYGYDSPNVTYAPGINLFEKYTRIDSPGNPANPGNVSITYTPAPSFGWDPLRMSWWHDAPSTLQISGRYLNKNADGTLTKVHLYASNNFNSQKAEIYVDGFLVYTSEGTGYYDNSPSSYLYDDVRFSNAYATYTRRDSTINSGGTPGVLNFFYNNSGISNITRYTPPAEERINPFFIQYNSFSTYIAGIPAPPAIAETMINLRSGRGATYPPTYEFEYIVGDNTSLSGWDYVQPTIPSREGYRLFPLYWTTPNSITSVQWIRPDAEGLSIWAYNIDLGDYLALLLDYYTDPTDDKLTVLISHLEVVYNNFASPRLMALLGPGLKYTIY